MIMNTKYYYLCLCLLSGSSLFSSPAQSAYHRVHKQSAKKVSVSAVANNGSWVMLSNNKKYMIAKDNTNTAAGWLAGPNVKLTNNPDPKTNKEYPYLITSETGAKVKAKPFPPTK